VRPHPSLPLSLQDGGECSDPLSRFKGSGGGKEEGKKEGESEKTLAQSLRVLPGPRYSG